ncbi:MAG: Activator of (R)-2-hydroxyglutaryl-CoA dehydratase [Firmicutes bacterium ADurb.Bin300]|nr:MAG: Activator of (R)-2-hydroxyglutaryl-CoA dehydratase [Firmicutes bacterium ADurb.Bin300]
MMNCWLGIDVGSVSTKLVLMDDEQSIIKKVYLKTGSSPMKSVLKGYEELFSGTKKELRICGAGTTGSGRRIAAAMTGADVAKNEITAHGVAAVSVDKNVRTVLEIGGQDSKIIFIKDGAVYDFNMNTVCAAGTGSFLDRQASRLGIPVSEIGALAEKSTNPVKIAGKCAVFAESDMIHRQQEGCKSEDILAGLCDALVRGYLNNLATGKKIIEPVMFQGGVAANTGIKRAFEKALGFPIKVPEQYDVMGAWGAAIIAQKKVKQNGGASCFVDISSNPDNWEMKSSMCNGCANCCTLVCVLNNGKTMAKWGGRCS